MFFITVCCAQRRTTQLTKDATFRVMTGALEHYSHAGKIWVRLFLAMPDHWHALMIFPPEVRMEKVLRDWKRFVAKQTGVAWQDGFFDHRLRREESFEEKSRYIRMNPVRAGLVTEPKQWRYVWPPRDGEPAR